MYNITNLKYGILFKESLTRKIAIYRLLYSLIHYAAVNVFFFSTTIASDRNRSDLNSPQMIGRGIFFEYSTGKPLF